MECYTSKAIFSNSNRINSLFEVSVSLWNANKSHYND